MVRLLGIQGSILMEKNPSSSRTDRKFIERNRRHQMKALYCKLKSLVPHQSPREAISLPDQLEEATNYIKKLQMNLEKMKEKKDNLVGSNPKPNFNTHRGMDERPKSPWVEIQEVGTTALQVVLKTGLDSQFTFNDIIRLLHEEGADIINASYAVAKDAVFHTIQCKVAESVNVAMISKRLKRF